MSKNKQKKIETKSVSVKKQHPAKTVSNKKNVQPPQQTEKAQREQAERDKAKKALSAMIKAENKSAKDSYEAGAALLAIQQEKLYKTVIKDTKFGSFKHYVGEMMHVSEQYAYMLINACKVQDILTKASIADSFVPEKLLRKLTYLLRVKDGSAKIEDIWKTVTDGKADKIPTDKELSNAVAASKQKKQKPGKTDSEILSDPNSGADEIIALLRRVSNGKAHLTEDDLETLKKRITAICDNAVLEND